MITGALAGLCAIAIAGSATPSAALSIARAMESLESGDSPGAVREASRCQDSCEFADWSHWIRATAALSSGARPIPARERSRIREHLRFVVSFPGSPLARRARVTLADLNLAEAEESLASGTARGVSVAWELSLRATRDLLELFPPALLPRKAITLLARVCEARGGSGETPAREACSAWLARIASGLPAADKHRLFLTKHLSPITSANGAQKRNGRVNAIYKAPDKDVESLDLALHAHQGSWRRHPRSCAESFETFLAAYPKSSSRHRARFWAGRCRRAEGREEFALRHWKTLLEETPLGFYGLATAAMMEAVPGRWLHAGAASQVSRMELAGSAETHWRISRADALRSASAASAEGMELAEIRPTEHWDASSVLALARRQLDSGQPYPALLAMTELVQRGSPLFASALALPLVFPEPSRLLVERAAHENGVDPLLFASLVKQESAWNPEAISSSGAIGYAQVMPATALELEPNLNLEEARQPGTSLRLGAAYLKRMMDRYAGCVIYALAAYNAGPTAADRWKSEADRAWDALDRIEAIPFRETRDYVGSILRNRYWYSRLKGVRGPPNLQLAAGTCQPSS